MYDIMWVEVFAPTIDECNVWHEGSVTNNEQYLMDQAMRLEFISIRFIAIDLINKR